MRDLIILLIFICFTACKETEKEYYSNGKLKFEINLKDSKFDGNYLEYFENGDLKIEGFFSEGLRQGSFTEYYPKGHKYSKSETQWEDDILLYQKNYGKNGNVVSEGELLGSNKYGEWKYYNHGYLKEVQEFFYRNDSTYLNQNWVLSKTGDTLQKGNHYKMISKDTINFAQQRIYFLLKQPYFSYKSEVFVCLPRNEEELNKDFSNEYDIQWDTINNLANRYRNQGKYGDRNLDVVFDLGYKTGGSKKLKGILIEKKQINNDSIEYDYATRKIYFDREIFIKN